MPYKNLDKRKAYHAAYSKKYHKAKPHVARRQVLRRKYGISLEDYNVMFAKQKGCCAICKRHQQQVLHTLHVDHNHKTGKVRALLCAGCNIRVGIIEKTDSFKSFMEYLQRFEHALA